MNKVIGQLGCDPEMCYTPNSQGVTSFSVASSRRYTASSGEQREVCGLERLFKQEKRGLKCGYTYGSGDWCITR